MLSKMAQMLTPLTEFCCHLGCDTVQFGSLSKVSEASTKEAGSSETLAPTFQKSVTFKRKFC
jgi:hypothetical protein